MQNDFASPRVVCRPALPGDATDVLEFTKFIWDGHDYIKYVWEDWLADPQGLLAVAEYAGHAVALGKVTYLSPGQWWLEGVRVDPSVQGLKIGSHIFEYLESWWKEQGGTLRWMTSSDRVQMHHLAKRSGYVKLGEVRSYTAPADQEASGAFRALEETEVERASQIAPTSLANSYGLMDWGWKFSAPDATALAKIAEDRRLYEWRNNAGLLSYWEDEDDGRKVLGVGLLACNTGSLKDMLIDLRRLAGQLGFDRLVWLAPAMEKVEAALQQAGFKTDWDGTGFLFEKRR